MSETFKQSYGVLQKHAQTLRKQSEPNIDDLLTIVEESVAAYKVCQTRIDAVEKEPRPEGLLLPQQLARLRKPPPDDRQPLRLGPHGDDPRRRVPSPQPLVLALRHRPHVESGNRVDPG